MKTTQSLSLLVTSLTLAAVFCSGWAVAQDTLWVTCSGDGTVRTVDLQNGFKLTTVATELSVPWGLAFDPHGNCFVSDTGHGTIQELRKDRIWFNFASGLNDPSGLYVDYNGSVYVAEYGSGCFLDLGRGRTPVVCGVGGPVSVRNPEPSSKTEFWDNRLKLLLTWRGNSPGGVVLVSRNADGTWTNQQTVASALSYPYDAIADEAGNLFVSEAGQGRILKYPAAGGGLVSTNPVVFARGFSPVGLVFDYAGNLYAADYGGGAIKKFAFSNGTLSTNPVAIVTGLSAPSYLAFPPPPIVRIRRVGGDVVLTWPDALFDLQTATSITGPFTTLPAATSPYTNAISGETRFFRLLSN